MKLPIKYNDAHWAVRKQAREQYVKEQEGKCWYCKTMLTDSPSEDIQNAYINLSVFPETMFNYPIHLHHCHKTGWTIGAIHARCNAWLWQYRGI